MSQLPVTGNAVNNGCARDVTDVYVNVWVYDRDERFMHLGFQGWVDEACALNIYRQCADISDLHDAAMADPLIGTMISLMCDCGINIGHPSRHTMQRLRLVAYNYQRATSHQTMWQDKGSIDKSIPNVIPTWGVLPETMTAAFTVLFMNDGDCNGFR